MNPYYDAMEHCAPPEGLRERMEQAALTAQPQNAKTFKPKGFRKKRTAALLLAAALIFTTGAASIWDPLLVRRFGPQAAMSYIGGAVFQEVNVTSVCDDVSLTVTQALCSDKSFYLLVEYKLPDGFDAGGGSVGWSELREYYATGDYTWEEFKALEGDQWSQYDWTDYTSCGDYTSWTEHEDYIFAPYNLLRRKEDTVCSSQCSGSGSFKEGYSPETNSITWMLSYDFDTGWNLNEQPLTILISPPILRAEDGTETAVTDHPAIVTFQPAYDGPQTLTGHYEEGDIELKATLSPFALTLEAAGMGYPYYEDMVKDVRLVTRDGAEKQVSLMGYTNGGGGIGDTETGESLEVSTTVHFVLITDTSDFTALRIGDCEVPLN